MTEIRGFRRKLNFLYGKSSYPSICCYINTINCPNFPTFKSHVQLTALIDIILFSSPTVSSLAFAFIKCCSISVSASWMLLGRMVNRAAFARTGQSVVGPWGHKLCNALRGGGVSDTAWDGYTLGTDGELPPTFSQVVPITPLYPAAIPLGSELGILQRWTRVQSGNQ